MKISGSVERQQQIDEREVVVSGDLDYEEELTTAWRRPAPPPGAVPTRRRRQEVSDAPQAEEDDEATLRELLMRYLGINI